METMAQIRDQLRCSPKLMHLFFELTDACNLSCLHCGSNASPCKNQYLDTQIIKQTLENVKSRYDSSKIMVCLTGGEPLLHPDFFDIAAYAHQLGFMCGMTTNATMIDDVIATKIINSGVRAIGISLDGPPQEHDTLRNQKGAFAAAEEGIANLVNQGRPTIQVTTVVHKQNISSLDALYDIVCKMKVHSWRIINIEPIGRAMHHQELLLDVEDMKYLLSYIKEKRFSPDTPVHVTYGCSHYLGVGHENMVRDHYFMCGAGITVGSILCNGDVYACLDIERRPELIQGNVYHDNFVDIWESKFSQFRQDRTLQCDECQNCPQKRFCNGDSAHTWDYDKNRPRVCFSKEVLQ